MKKKFKVNYKEGDKIKWQYTHWLNSISSTEIVKTGVFIEITGAIKKTRYVSGTHAKVLFDGNKTPSIVPLSDIVPA